MFLFNTNERNVNIKFELFETWLMLLLIAKNKSLDG